MTEKNFLNEDADLNTFWEELATGTTDNQMRNLYPDWDSLSPVEQANARAKIKTQQEADRQAMFQDMDNRNAAAQAEHGQMMSAVSDQPMITAVLELHRPTNDGLPDCAHCLSMANGNDGNSQRWPCPTFRAVQQAYEETQ